MDKMTITEALAEVKLLLAKIAKKKEVVLVNVTRYSHVADPFIKDGGGKEMVRRELQAIRDLDIRLVRIRLAIARANLATKLTIGTVERTITEWLAWRKEVADGERSLLMAIAGNVNKTAKQAEQNPPAYKDETGKVKIADLLYNVDADAINLEAQGIDEVLGVLDGKLSLLNATTVVEF